MGALETDHTRKPPPGSRLGALFGGQGRRDGAPVYQAALTVLVAPGVDGPAPPPQGQATRGLMF